MICLLLIMTIIFINITESAEQKIRHIDTLLKEEMSAKTKIWLLMVESGKVDQEEFRRITPKSIFIAPLLTSGTGKCKEGYRHDHLGQCVKVIKIDPKVQLELLLQRLNQLYSEKRKETAEQKEEERKTEETKVSSGPLHFSLPISNVNEKIKKESNETKLETLQQNFGPTGNFSAQKTETTPESIPIPLPMMYQNQTHQIKDIESSGAEPLNITEPVEIMEFEGSGDGQVSLGDDNRQEDSTTEPSVSIFFEETDYFDTSETESTTDAETQFTITPLLEEFSSIKPGALKEVSSSESYQNTTNTPSVNDVSGTVPKENIQAQKEIIVKASSNSDKIIFPNDDNDWNKNLRYSPKSLPQSSRIKFPDEVSQPLTPSYHSLLDLSANSNKYQTHSSSIPRDQFWWLPKNWQIDENEKKSPLVKVWSRLPLIHDISYSPETSEVSKKSDSLEKSHTQMFNAQRKNKEHSVSLDQQQPSVRIAKPFRSSHFQDIKVTERQHFRLHR